MSLEKDFNLFAQETREFHGEMRQYMKNTNNWLGAVNAKLNGHLDEHTLQLKDDIKQERKSALDRLGLAVTALISVGGVVFEYMRGRR